jgi:hypothetical protein
MKTKTKPVPEATFQPALCWEAGRLTYTVEVSAYPVEILALEEYEATEVWLTDEATRIFIGIAKNFRTADLADGRQGVIICDLTMEPNGWREGWNEHGRLRMWAQKSVRKLRAGNYDLIGPVKEVRYGP